MLSGRNGFLKPNTRLLTNVATPIDCNRFLPPYFNLEGVWHQFLPQPARVEAPQILAPHQKPTWKYEELDNIMANGIYRQEELDRLHEHLIFNDEKQAVVETVARRISDKTRPDGSPDLSKLLDLESISNIVHSVFSHLWSSFTQFGIAAAGILTIIMLFQILKFVLDTLLRRHSLYTVYGWSSNLLAAVWSTIAHLLLSLMRPNAARPDPEATHMQHEGEAQSTNRVRQGAARQSPAYRSVPPPRRTHGIELERRLAFRNAPSDD